MIIEPLSQRNTSHRGSAPEFHAVHGGRDKKKAMAGRALPFLSDPSQHPDHVTGLLFRSAAVLEPIECRDRIQFPQSTFLSRTATQLGVV